MKQTLCSLAACVAPGLQRIRLRATARRPAAAAPTASVNTQPRVDVLGMARPIDMHDSVWIEDLTMMEVRDLLKAGKTTALILTGGIEENGPYLTTGKHNNVLRVMGESIARASATRWSRRSSHSNPATPNASGRPVRCSSRRHLSRRADRHGRQPEDAGLQAHHSAGRQRRQFQSRCRRSPTR